MITSRIFLKLTGIALVAAFILSACNTAATVAPAPTWTASPPPLLLSATATPVPTIASTPTDTPTASATATPTVQPVAQVIPGTDAYCRKGPGSDYGQITTLIGGMAYNVIGRNSLNTWWLVQLWDGVTCWTGAPGTSQVGPVEQVPMVLAQPQLPSPAMFMYSYSCDTANTNTLTVTLTWHSVAGATGYHLYRNGVSLAEVGVTTTLYIDYNAPMKVNLEYKLEALNTGGSTAPVYVTVPACN